LFSTQSSSGDHATETNGAVSDYGCFGARVNSRSDGGVITGSHHVGEGEERWQRFFSAALWNDEERSIRLRNPERLGLSTRNVFRSEEAAMETRSVKSLLTELAGTIGECERHDRQVAGLERAD
jgi:hypothetical protein